MELTEGAFPLWFVAVLIIAACYLIDSVRELIEDWRKRRQQKQNPLR